MHKKLFKTPKGLYKTLECLTCKQATLHIQCLSRTREVLVYACMECATEHAGNRKLQQVEKTGQ